MQIDEIKELIAKGHVNDALSKTMYLTKFINIDHHKQSIILLSRYNQINNAERAGMIRKGDNVEKNDIVDSLLQILLDIELQMDDNETSVNKNSSIAKENEELKRMLEILQSQNKSLSAKISQDDSFSNSSALRLVKANKNEKLVQKIFIELGIEDSFIQESLKTLNNISEKKNTCVKNQQYEKAADLRQIEVESEKNIIINIVKTLESKKALNKSKYFNNWVNTKEYNILELMVSHPELSNKSYEHKFQKEIDESSFIRKLRIGIVNLIFNDICSFIVLSSIITSDNNFYNLISILFEKLRVEKNFSSTEPSEVESERRQLIFRFFNWIQSLSITDLNFKYVTN